MISALVNMREASVGPSLQRKGMTLLIILMTFGFSLSFRERDLGETNLDIQNGTKFIFWIFILGIALLNVNKIQPLIATPSGRALSLLTILALTSAAWSEKPFYSLACAIGFAAYSALASMSLYEYSDVDFYKIMRHSLFAFVCIGFVGAAFFPELVWQPPSVEETTNRLQGFAVNPNNFGRVAALLFLLGLGAWMTDEKRSFTLAFSIAIGLTGLILSGSRTALLASLLAASFVLFRKNRIFQLSLFSIALLSVGVLFFMSYGVSLTTLFKNFSRTGLESEVLTLTGRTELWSAAFEMIAERPLFGWGYNSTEEQFSLLFNHEFYGTPVNPHQMLLHLTLGVGLVGASLALVIFSLRLRTMVTRPNILNDLICLFILIYGLTEVDHFGTPLFTSLIFFRITLQDGLIRGYSR